MGKSKNTTVQNQQTSNTNTAYAPVKPVLDAGAITMNNFMSNPEANAVYSGPRVADMSGATQTGVGMMQDSAGANEAMNYYRGIMGQGAGTNNPQIQQMQDAIKRQVLAANNAQFSRSGMTGGTAHQESLSKGLADGMAQPLFAAYENDMNRQMSAAGNLANTDQMRIGNQMGAGQVLDSYGQAKINADMQKFEQDRTAPLKAWSEVAPMATQMGSMFGTQNGTQNGTSTQSSQQPWGNMVAGGLMAGAGLMTGNPMMAMGGLGAAAGGGGGAGASTPWSWNTNPSTFANFSNQYTPGEVLPWARQGGR